MKDAIYLGFMFPPRFAAFNNSSVKILFLYHTVRLFIHYTVYSSVLYVCLHVCIVNLLLKYDSA